MTAMTDEKRVSDDTSQPDMQGLDPKALEVACIAFCENDGRIFADLPPRDQLHMRYSMSAAFAAIASLPQQTAEPVACPGHDCLRRDGIICAGGECDIASGLIASPPVGGAVKVKTLEWRTIGSLQQAETSIGWYTVIREPNAEEFPWLVSLRGQGLQSFMREADAKDFAQRHFTECIQGGVTDNALSALASSERSGREAATHLDPFEEMAFARAIEKLRAGPNVDDHRDADLLNTVRLRYAPLPPTAIRNLAGTKTNDH